jgi:hypothetical protein
MGIPSQAINQIMTLTEQEKAYIAGLFDGEGCVGYYNRGTIKNVSYHSASVIVTMTDPRPITWLKTKTGMGNISVGVKSGNRRNAYSWQLSNQKQIIEFLSTIRPFLMVKADQVDLLFQLWQEEEETLPEGPGRITEKVVKRREEAVTEIKNLKSVVYVVEGVETRRAESSIRH